MGCPRGCQRALCCAADLEFRVGPCLLCPNCPACTAQLPCQPCSKIPQPLPYSALTCLALPLLPCPPIATG